MQRCSDAPKASSGYSSCRRCFSLFCLGAGSSRQLPSRSKANPKCISRHRLKSSFHLRWGNLSKPGPPRPTQKGSSLEGRTPGFFPGFCCWEVLGQGNGLQGQRAKHSLATGSEAPQQ